MGRGDDEAILVTGAAGFIGSHLCEALLRRGYRVRGLDALTDFYDPARKRLNLVPLLACPGFDLVEEDLLTADLAPALEGVGAIVHLAGEPGVSASWGPSFARYVDRNLLATQRLLEVACGHPVRRFVYASSSSVYGADAGAPQGRSEPRPFSPYGVSKLAAEALVGAYAVAYGVPTVSLRYFSVYGPRQRPDMAAHRFIEALLDGVPLTVFGDGSQARDFTYVGDIVAATVRALTADLPPATVLDVANGNPVTVAGLIECLHELLGVAGASLHHREERRGDVPRTMGDTATTRSLLGWGATTDLPTGLRRQLQWHLALRQQPTASTSGLRPSVSA
ncbi:NAD-dependent epimerase/dehydratase family protein [Phycicoccus sp. Soil748]|uniref:NAD-dependent epimerase/dehydratase family protein n=1 Tax=Intrasporangiaceae TaxID=85021 RepID=UPI0009EC879F|nr:NAD-dependent epimerase/dehydratase family protein [Phycicoccus sp. Soil748]